MRASTIARESLSLNVQSTFREKPMKIVIAQMKHETNTFSPVATLITANTRHFGAVENLGADADAMFR
jgi:hypothetical protein